MAIVRINAKTPTKISDGGCSVFATNLTQLVSLTDAEGNLLTTTYANSVTPIPSDVPVYARSNSKDIDLAVSSLQPLYMVKNFVVGTQEEIDEIIVKRSDYIYVVVA